ncbi:hypothetical protein ACIOWF_05140 [Cellulosimicrobium cellulans]|uniref:hypothetical protein n=1 Tax=Cellulosimicrobium cellulans TaxID=1710 RepID=UPI003826652C
MGHDLKALLKRIDQQHEASLSILRDRVERGEITSVEYVEARESLVGERDKHARLAKQVTSRHLERVQLEEEDHMRGRRAVE